MICRLSFLEGLTSIAPFTMDSSRAVRGWSPSIENVHNSHFADEKVNSVQPPIYHSGSTLSPDFSLPPPFS